MKQGLLWVVLVPALWHPAGADAGTVVYRWIDAQGQAHYADHPGTAGARQLERYEASLSVIDTTEARRQAARGPNPLVERELRWQQTGREEQRRAAEKEIEAKTRRCARLRADLDAAEDARKRERARSLEGRWYRECR